MTATKPFTNTCKSSYAQEKVKKVVISHKPRLINPPNLLPSNLINNMIFLVKNHRIGICVKKVFLQYSPRHHGVETLDDSFTPYSCVPWLKTYMSFISLRKK